MANLCIVAIPASNDDIWEESSEKVPHLTFMFLGDADTNPNFEEICEQVGKYCSRMEPFSLRVDHRGVLGPDKADVLFFADDIPYPVLDFRSMCLGDVNISSAYNSVQQYTKWNPHLTLGYPETPAKGWDGDEGEIDYITFDKIAVWNGDYSGQTFQLIEGADDKPYPTDLAVPEAAWSEKLSDILEHHGVKGMRWGVRKAYTERLKESSKLNKSIGKGEHGKTITRVAGGKSRASKRSANLDAHIKRIESGKKSSKDLLKVAGHIGLSDIVVGAKYASKASKEAKSSSKVTVTQKGKKLKAAGGKNLPANKDAVVAKTLGQKAKKSGHQSLSNEELQKYATRLNLEQNVKRLEQQNKSGSRRFVGGLLKSQGSQSANKAAGTAISKAGSAAVKMAVAA